MPRQVRHCGEGGVAVAGAREVRATCATEVFELVERGKAGRATFATNANAHSSRSHLLVGFLVRVCNALSGEESSARLWLVDLAGSERLDKTGAEGDRLKEALVRQGGRGP